MNKRLLSAPIRAAEVGVLLATALLLSAASVRAQGALVVYCSVEDLVHRHMPVAIKLDEVGKHDERPLDAFDGYNPVVLCR